VTDGGGWLEARDLRKAYDGALAVDGVSMSLARGEIRGLIGANGAGKSTLVKALCHEVTLDGGVILVDGAPADFSTPADARRAGIAYVPQELTVAPRLTVAENVVLGRYPSRRGVLRGRELAQRAGRVLDALSLSLPLNIPVGELSVVDRRLVMVARALAADARLVMFDEPTATMSPTESAFILDVVRTLAQRGVTILYVSHRLDQVIDVCDSVTAMRDAKVVAELRGSAIDHSTLVELISPTAGPERELDAAAAGEPGPPVLRLRDVTGAGFRGVTFDVCANEIVGLAGLAGSGVTELLLAVAGATPFSGSVEVDGRPMIAGRRSAAAAAGIGFVPGDRRLGVVPNETISHNISLPRLTRYASLGVVRRGRERDATIDAARRTALTPPRAGLAAGMKRPISSLSGGNQQKALVARWLDPQTRVLLLDDPTAGVDVGARREIHHQIRAFCAKGVAVVLVSTDLDELATLADRILVVDHGVVVDELSRGEASANRIFATMTRAAV
jgi:ABC-type sugar transport system ATPase subunit